MENLIDAPLTTRGHPAWPSDMPQGGSSPRAIVLGPSRWDTSNLTLHSHQCHFDSDNDATCYTAHQHNYR